MFRTKVGERRSPVREMITRSKLVQQLRDNQIRSQYKCHLLVVFSPKLHIKSWADVAVAIFWALLFMVLVLSSYVALYYRHFWLSSVIMCLGILLPVRLGVYRQALLRKRDRLPLTK